MQTTTATYVINVTTEDENVITFYKTMPTKPKTSKGENHRTISYVSGWKKSILILLHTKFFLFPNELHSQRTPTTCQQTDRTSG